MKEYSSDIHKYLYWFSALRSIDVLFACPIRSPVRRRSRTTHSECNIIGSVCVYAGKSMNEMNTARMTHAAAIPTLMNRL